MVKIYTALVFLSIICWMQNIRAAEDCDESGVCKLPGAASETDNGVLSPVGLSSIKAIKQPQRLNTLNGKNILCVKIDSAQRRVRKAF